MKDWNINIIGYMKPCATMETMALDPFSLQSGAGPMVAMRGYSTHLSAVLLRKFYCVFVSTSSQHKAICGTEVKERVLKSENIPYRLI